MRSAIASGASDGDGALVPLGQPPQEMRRKQRDVLAPLGERRKAHRHHVEAVVEVLAEPAGGFLRLEVPVGGRNHADVDRDRLRRADRADLAFLQHAQQLHLKRERHVADLVQEDRAAIGRLEQPLVRLHRAAERAARMAEELGFEQRLGNRPAVDGDERLVAARARPVDRAGQELLARSRVAEDQHARIGIGDAARLPQQVLHLRAPRDDAGAPFAGGFRSVARGVPRERHCRRDLLQQLLAVERLGEEPEYAALLSPTRRQESFRAP